MILTIIVIASLVTTLLGGLFAIKFKDQLHLILGFSAGTVLGVALFDLIPETIELTKGVYDFETIAILIALGFSFYMLLDRFSSLHGHHDHDCKNPSHKRGLGASALIFHSFLDGLGIGLAFKVSPTIGWVVAAAVLAHKFSDGINTVNMILLDKGDKKTAIKWLVLAAIAPAAGVLASNFFSVSESVLGMTLAVFVGLFLYISAADLIPESHHRHPTIWTSLMTIFGIAVMYLAVLITG